jgi:2-hydroxycyclohexanecarboxyl-CoA dehydrogenase
MGMLDGKVAIITGAGRGLGRATANVFAKEGAALALVDIDGGTVEAASREVAALGAKAIGIKCDVQNQADVNAAVLKTVDAFGTVDVLIQYAQYIKIEVPFEDLPESEFVAMWRSGVLGSIFFMQACFPYMRGRGGKVINVASGVGVNGARNMSGYAIAKEGIRGLTKAAANEWGKHNITVNVICPSAQSAAFERWQKEQPERFKAVLDGIPLGRVGDPELDIGRAVLALVGPDMRFLTGATIMLDGGTTLIS